MEHTRFQICKIIRDNFENTDFVIDSLINETSLEFYSHPDPDTVDILITEKNKASSKDSLYSKGGFIFKFSCLYGVEKDSVKSFGLNSDINKKREVVENIIDMINRNTVIWRLLYKKIKEKNSL